MSKLNKKGNPVEKYTAIGIALGVAFGAAFDNVGVGLAIGLAIGVAYGASIKKRQDRTDLDKTGNLNE